MDLYSIPAKVLVISFSLLCYAEGPQLETTYLPLVLCIRLLLRERRVLVRKTSPCLGLGRWPTCSTALKQDQSILPTETLGDLVQAVPCRKYTTF